MSKELLNKFNQVLRPYYAELTRPSICDNAALQQYLDRLCADQEITSFLRTMNSDIEALFSNLDETNQKVLAKYLKVRFFKEALAASVTQSVLSHFDSDAIMAFAREVQQSVPFTLANERDLFNIVNLLQVVTLAFAAKCEKALQDQGIDCSYRLPEINNASLAEIMPEANTTAMLARASRDGYKYHNLYRFCAKPQILQAISRDRACRETVDNCRLIRSIISQADNAKVYYDARGTAYINRVPAGSDKSDFYLTRTFATAIHETRANVAMFTLGADSLKAFSTNDCAKVLSKQQVNVLVSNIVNTMGLHSTSSFNLEQTFADCANISGLIKFMEQVKQPYKLSLQFSSLNTACLQLLFTAQVSEQQQELAPEAPAPAKPAKSNAKGKKTEKA